MNAIAKSRAALLLAGLASMLPAASFLLAEEPSASVALTSDERVRCLSILRSGLASEEFWPSMHAAEALTLAGQQKEVLAALRNRLPLETDDQRRCGLARELVRAGDRMALPTLIRILNDERSTGRVHAAESLFKLGEAGEETGLARAMSQSANVQLQLMSAGALARGGSRSAMELLRKRLQSGDRLARNTVCFVLARVGQSGDLAPLRARFAEETDPLARANLVNALACLGDPQGTMSLQATLASPDAGIRASAAEHAGLARGAIHRPRLVELLDDPVLDVRVRAAQSLFALSLPAAEWKKP